MRNTSSSHTQLLSVNDVVRVRSSDSTEPVHLPTSAAGKTMAVVSSPARRPTTSSSLSPSSPAPTAATAAAMVTPGRPISKFPTTPPRDCSSPWRTKEISSVFRPEPFGSMLSPPPSTSSSSYASSNDASPFPDLLSMGRSNAFDEDDAEF